jgi:hypothetical protein
MWFLSLFYFSFRNFFHVSTIDAFLGLDVAGLAEAPD